MFRSRNWSRISGSVRHSRRALIEYCLAALSDSEREILLLHAVSGFKQREIADMLALPLATVLSKYSRSLKKVRTHLAKEERTDDK